jgi:leader peptidase (prepilin peptidase)/N-methyltransferase
MSPGIGSAGLLSGVLVPGVPVGIAALGVVAVFGAMIGSFLNVCVCRWPAGESVVRPRSHCRGCQTPISWRDNIPVVSWLLLAGRCRSCSTPIPARYPAVELATALIWTGLMMHYGLGWRLLTAGIFFTILLGIAITDAAAYLIPDEFSLGGLALGLLLAFAPGGMTIRSAVTGAVLGFSLLYVTAAAGEKLLKKPAMGGGDIKMLAMVGAFLGPWGAVLSLFLGSLVGSIVFLPVSFRSRRPVPFGVFLAVGAVITELWGAGLMEWYRTDLLGF